MAAKNRIAAVVWVVLVLMCTLVCFAACGENYAVEIKTSAEYKIEVTQSNQYALYYDVEWVRWTANGALVTVHYTNGVEVTTASSVLLIKVTPYDN